MDKCISHLPVGGYYLPLWFVGASDTNVLAEKFRCIANIVIDDAKKRTFASLSKSFRRYFCTGGVQFLASAAAFKSHKGGREGKNLRLKKVAEKADREKGKVENNES